MSFYILFIIINNMKFNYFNIDKDFEIIFMTFPISSLYIYCSTISLIF